jgi:hypothetical protein
MSYTYPNTVYDVAENLLSVLGSFWAETYRGQSQALAFAASKSQLENQTMLDVLDALAAVSRFTVPIFKKKNWFPLVLRESQRNDATTSLPKYDDGSEYDAGLSYDSPNRAVGSAFPKPAGLTDAPLMMNRFTAPSLVWTRGIDYTVAADAVVFAVNPFAETRFAIRDVHNGEIIIDRELIIWIFRGDFDWDAVYRQFGYVLKMRLASSAGYRDLMNAAFDGLISGTTRSRVMAGFSAITGIPLARGTEIVEDIWMDSRGRLVITDKNVYRFAGDATVIVATGDTVHAGDPLVDALRVFEFNRGHTPPDLAALSLGRGFLANCFYSELVFENKSVPLTVITDDPSGYTKVTWPLGGFPADVDRFFDEMHARGVAAAEAPIGDCEECLKVRYPGIECGEGDRFVRVGTMAHYLDKRTVRVGEPTAGNLPLTINPLEFLIQNVLRNNAWLVRIKASHLGRDGLGLHNARFIQRMTPPHTAMFVLIDITAQADSVTASQLTETPTTFTAMAPLADTVPSDFVSDRPRLHVVAGIYR